MACTIVIQDVLGQGQPGATLTSLKVSGAATGCSKVNVSIVCTSQAVTHANVPVSGGQWETVFTEQELKIAGCRECGSPSYPITVRVNCADPGAACSDYKVFSEIPCAAGCPTIESIEADVPPCNEVAAAGGWNVVFNAHINGSGVTFCLWNFGDGSSPVSGSLPQGGVATAQHLYGCAGTYPVTLTIFSDCEPNYVDSKVLELDLPTCGCPTVNSFDAQQDSVNRCRWTFEAKIGSPFVGCIDEYLWNFGDGHQETTGLPQVDHVYDHDGHYTVTLTLVGRVGQVGGGPCYATKEIDVTGCKPTNGGDGGNGKPCPWWDPRCWKSLCGALLGAAMAALILAGLLFIIAGCTVLTPAVLAGPAGAAINALVTSALFIAAVAALVLGLALLTTWFLVCSKLPGYHFCATLHQLITGISWIIAAQVALGLVLFAFGGVGCLIGVILTLGSWGTVLAYLQLLSNAAGCSH